MCLCLCLAALTLHVCCSGPMPTTPSARGEDCPSYLPKRVQSPAPVGLNLKGCERVSFPPRPHPALCFRCPSELIVFPVRCRDVSLWRSRTESTARSLPATICCKPAPLCMCVGVGVGVSVAPVPVPVPVPRDAGLRRSRHRILGISCATLPACPVLPFAP